MAEQAKGGPGEIRVEVRDDIGWLTIARPTKRNALTASMWTAIPEVIRALAARDDLAAIFLQGAEGTFAAGADLEDVVAATAGPAEAAAYCTSVVTALLAVATCRLPTIAFVAGAAAGGGAELAIAADVRVADTSAVFSFPFARLGVTPDRFTLERLVALVGASHARRFVFTGETIDATRALAIGLVDEVVPLGALVTAASSWTQTMTRGSTRVRVAMKQTMNEREAAHDVASLVAPMVESFVGGEVRAAALRFLHKSSP
jgi:enoyl-CoA hydratase/carnithine racemase